MVIETISGRAMVSNAYVTVRSAPSVAYPRPWNAAASRHPISTAGANGSCGPTGWRPMKPANSPVSRTSTAQSPHPRSLMPAVNQSAKRSLSARVSGFGKCRITTGSAFIAANDSRSAARH